MKNLQYIIIIIFLSIIAGFVLVRHNLEVLSVATQSIFCTTGNDEFSEFRSRSGISMNGGNKINQDGTIKYFYDDFTGYRSNSHIVSDFESIDGIKVSDNASTKLNSKKVLSGKKSLQVDYISGSTDNNIVITTSYNKPLDLGVFADSGVLTGWLNINNRSDITSLKVSLFDEEGNYREYNVVDNSLTSIPNFYDKDDVYPDMPFKYKNSSSDEWTDYWINDGWNLFFLRNDQGFYRDDGPIDFKKISKLQLSVTINPKNKNISFILDNIRFISGLQKQDNTLSPNWFPPNGRPQYGIYDIDDSGVKLLNIRQSQYLSNGDHGRMLTQGLTPMNFELRTKFTIKDLGANGDINNTWFRLMYDFDPDYDPGHDWFGVFDSFEWKQMGLITVVPIERFFLQTQEPLKENIGLSSTGFKMSNDGEYEIQMKVIGQKADVWVYSVGNGCLRLKKHIAYTFDRVRSINHRLPFGIEVTGDVKAEIHEVEISEI